MIVQQHSAYWNGVSVFGVLATGPEYLEDWARVYLQGLGYLAVVDERRLWWLVPNVNDDSMPALGPYTYEHVVALVVRERLRR